MTTPSFVLMFSCLALTFQHKSNTPKNINGERGSENLNEHQRRGQRRKRRIKQKRTNIQF